MASITRENIAPLTDKIIVQLKKEDYYPSFEKSLKTYSKQAKMPGFRPGQVPTSLVKKMYGPSAFSDEVLKTVEKEINGYLANEKPEIFAQPLPSDNNATILRKLDMNNPSELSFEFEIGLKPAFTIAPLANATINRKIVQVTDEMVNEELARLQTRHGKMTEPETVTSNDNTLNVTFTETDAQGNIIEGGITKANSLIVSYFSEAVRPKLMGLKIGDHINIQLKEAFEDKELGFISKDLGLDEDAADTEKYFNVTINKIGLVEKRELDETFFNEVYTDRAIGTEAEFRDALKADIQAYWINQDRGQVQDQIFHYLVDHTNVEFPEAFLKRWIQAGGEKPKTAEEAEAEFPSFKNSLKWSLISDSLIKDNNFDVTPEELKEFGKMQMLSYMGGQMPSGDLGWLDGYMDKMMQDKKFVEQTYNQVITDKLFVWAEGQVQYKDEPVSVEEFEKQLAHHREHHHH